MKLKAKYESADQIPEGFNSLFEEREGQFILTGVEGLPTVADISRLEGALVKERNDHKRLREEVKTKYGEFDPEQFAKDRDELADLRLRVKDGDSKSDEVLEQRLKIRLAPLEREKEKFKIEVEALKAKESELTGFIARSQIESHIRKAAEAAKVTNTAIDDVVMLGVNLFEVTSDGQVIARDDSKISMGATPDIWLSDMKEKRPHWWPMSQGGGSSGGRDMSSGGANPWSKNNWSLTEQGAYMQKHGREKAEAAARAAGVKVGATSPSK